MVPHFHRVRLTLGSRSMHRGKKPRQAKTRQPRIYRLAAHAEIPRADHGIGAADQIVDRQQPHAAVAHRDAAVGGIVPVSPSTNSWPGGTVTSGVLSSRPLSRILKIGVADAVRQRLDEAVGPLGVATIVFGLA